MSRQPDDSSRLGDLWRRWLFWAVAATVALFLFQRVGGALAPLLVALLIAMALEPAAARLVARGIGRTAAAAIVTIVVFGLVLLAIGILMPLLVQQAAGFAIQLPDLAERGGSWIVANVGPLAGRLGIDTTGGDRIDVQTLLRQAGNAGLSLVTIGLTLAEGLLAVFLVPFLAFYLIRDWTTLEQRAEGLLPRRSAPVVLRIVGKSRRRLGGWIRGQGLVVLVQATAYAVGLTLIGLDYGLLIGVAAGLLSLVPIVGQAIMFTVALTVALLQTGTWWQPALVVALFLAMEVIEASVLSPNLVGDRIRLHPVWVIMALLVGGQVGGFAGVLFALPVAAVLEVIAEEIGAWYRDSRLYREV